MPANYMPSDALVEQIARDLCELRGEEPGGTWVHMKVHTTDGALSGRPTSGTNLEAAMRDVRFVLGWINLHAQTVQGEPSA